MKKIQLKPGVHLVVMPTKQFKTLNIAVDFAAPLLASTTSARALLTYLTAVSAQKYPNQQAVAQKTIDLYGAQYQTDVTRFGQTHHIRYQLQMPAPIYLNSADAGYHLLTDAFDFMRDMIFEPLVTDKAFNQSVFLQEQQSLINEIDGLIDDKKRYAALKLRELTYSLPAMQRPTLGTVEDVKALTPASVYSAYQSMVTSDEINIIVFGDVSEADILPLLDKWPLHSRTQQPLQPFYRQGLRPATVEITETQANLTQAVLMIAYQLSLAPDSPQRFTAVILNALFGGSPLSKLFANVREKSSLAYTIYSRWQHDTGFLTVAAGLASDKVELADHMIQAELQAIKQGNIKREILEAIKTSVVNDYLSQQDSPNSEMTLAFSRLLTQRETPTNEWVNAIMAVSVEDVAQLAQAVVLQTRFTLLPEAVE